MDTGAIVRKQLTLFRYGGQDLPGETPLIAQRWRR
jgi:hypothetical protein